MRYRFLHLVQDIVLRIKQELIDFALTLSGAAADCPFEGDSETTVLRHSDTGKWFGIIMLHNGEHIVNLKCEPLHADFLRGVYKGVTPAYHMNKTNWISVALDEADDDEIKALLDMSYALTMPKVKKASK